MSAPSASCAAAAQPQPCGAHSAPEAQGPGGCSAPCAGVPAPAWAVAAQPGPGDAADASGMPRGRSGLSAPDTSTPPAACAPAAGPAASAAGGVVEVLGLACRFPESASAGAVWRLTADARRWPPGALGTPARCGKLPDADRFDAGFFSVHGKQAQVRGARESAALCRPPGGVNRGRAAGGVLASADRTGAGCFAVLVQHC